MSAVMATAAEAEALMMAVSTLVSMRLLHGSVLTATIVPAPVGAALSKTGEG